VQGHWRYSCTAASNAEKTAGPRGTVIALQNKRAGLNHATVKRSNISQPEICHFMGNITVL